jgi:hypothetical protein
MNYLKERAAGELELIRWREVMGNREPGKVDVSVSVEIDRFRFTSTNGKLPNIVGMIEGRVKGPRSKTATGKPAIGATFAAANPRDWKAAQRGFYEQAMRTGQWA